MSEEENTNNQLTDNQADDNHDNIKENNLIDNNIENIIIKDTDDVKETLENLSKNNTDNISNTFIIKQGRFEGPYMKLLEMIENRKLSISEISLSQVADDYIAFIQSLKNNNYDIRPEDLSQFVLIASTLMLIKARSLLPDIKLELSEEKEISQLEHKLELLKLLKIAENNIKSCWKSKILYSRDRIIIKEKTFLDPSNFNKENLHSTLLLTLAKMPNFERLKSVAVQQVRKLEDVITNILQRIQDQATSLRDFANNLSSTDNREDVKKNLIVSFLAILELLKQNIIVAHQEEGDIKISKI